MGGTNVKQAGYRLRTLAFLCWFAVTAQADSAWHGEIALVSDYIYRGYSKSRGNPVVQANLEYQNPLGWYAGIGLSQVRFDDHQASDRAEMELRPYVGWSQSLLAELRGEIMIKGYVFDNKLFNQRAEYAEFYGLLHYQDWLSLQVSFAADAYQRSANTVNYEINLRRDLLDNLQLSTGVGFYQAGSLLGQEFFYWNAGISWFATDNLAIDLRYVDSALQAHQHHDTPDDSEFYPRQQDNQYLFSLRLGF